MAHPLSIGGEGGGVGIALVAGTDAAELRGQALEFAVVGRGRGAQAVGAVLCAAGETGAAGTTWVVAKGRTLGRGEADSGIFLAVVLCVGGKDGEVVETGHLCALVDESVGDNEIGVERGVDGWPTGLIGVATSTVEDQRLKGGCAIKFDALDVLQERLTLGAHDLRGQGSSWLRGGDWRIEGVEKGVAVVFVERLKRHLIDERLQRVRVSSRS